MVFRVRLILALAGVCCSVACSPQTTAPTCTGTSLSVRTKGVLTVAADLSYPPFSYDRPNKEPAGFDADLIRAIAKVLEVRVLLVNRGPAALVPGLIAHRHDVAAGGLRETEQLRGEVCMSIPYLDANLGVLVPAPDPHQLSSADDLSGRRVAVVDGGRAEAWVKDELADAEIVRVATDDDVVASVRERRVDAAVAELPVARYTAKRSKDISVGWTIETGERYVLAVAPDNQALVDKLNAALERLSSKGRLAKIERKWFGD